MLLTTHEIDKIIEIARKYHIRRLILFGSALNKFGDYRDIDLACEGLSGWTLYEFGSKIEDLLNKPVDVVPLTPPNRFTHYIESKGQVLL
jgi:predicted nucleotidyltransferase